MVRLPEVITVLLHGKEDAALMNHEETQIWIAGVDGFKSQWCAILQAIGTDELRTRVVPSFAGLLNLAEQPAVITVDIPIGLPEFTLPGGRNCEKEARRLVDRKASTVFSSIGRVALHERPASVVKPFSRVSETRVAFKQL